MANYEQISPILGHLCPKIIDFRHNSATFHRNYTKISGFGAQMKGIHTSQMSPFCHKIGYIYAKMGDFSQKLAKFSQFHDIYGPKQPNSQHFHLSFMVMVGVIFEIEVIN